MPKVSVILPVYNAEKYLSKCIQSILDQSFQDFELIIVTNGSNEATLKEIARFKDERIKKYHLENPSVVDAANLAIQQSSTPFIARIDADDIAPENRLELQLNFLESHPKSDVVSGKVNYLGDEKTNQGYYLHVEWLNSLRDPQDIYLNRFVDSPVANPSLMMRKSLFDKYGLYRKGDFPEDYEVILRWLEAGVRIGKVDGEVLHWRDHPQRLTRNHDSYSQDAFFRIKTQYFARWFKSKFPWKSEALIWGKGKSVRAKSRFLSENGIEIAGYIDVKKPFHESGVIPTYHYTDFPKDLFILSYVSDRKGRISICNSLKEKQLEEGKDFYMMA